MSRVVSFRSPRVLEVIDEPPPAMAADKVRVRTLFSGISAGTELTAYRGSNPYLTKRWEEDGRLFVPDAASLEYPVEGWGYEEVGEVVEIGAGVRSVSTGDVVWGTWGHRSTAVLSETAAATCTLPADVDPI